MQTQLPASAEQNPGRWLSSGESVVDQTIDSNEAFMAAMRIIDAARPKAPAFRYVRNDYRDEVIDITYDGLALSVNIEWDNDGDAHLIEIMAASDGTEITHIFTNCVQRLIKSAALDAIKANQAAGVN